MRAIVLDTYGSPDVFELPHQALGFLSIISGERKVFSLLAFL